MLKCPGYPFRFALTSTPKDVKFLCNIQSSRGKPPALKTYMGEIVAPISISSCPVNNFSSKQIHLSSSWSAVPASPSWMTNLILKDSDQQGRPDPGLSSFTALGPSSKQFSCSPILIAIPQKLPLFLTLLRLLLGFPSQHQVGSHAAFSFCCFSFKEDLIQLALSQ